MPDIDELRDLLRNARQEAAAAETKVLVAREKVRRTQATLQDFERQFDANRPADVAERDRLANELGDLQSELAEFQSSFKLAREEIRTISTNFGELADPTTQIEKLDDEIPILLFPVRLETRFKKIVVDEHTANERIQDQLWIRIYPDDCLVDTFEETLSETEIRNARRYWKSIWQGGGIEDAERAAWRSLCASHKPGRAEWIVKNYRPTNETDRPMKVDAGDVILVIESESMLPIEERSAAEQFWRSIWLADRNVELENAARSALEAAIGSEAAKRIVDQYRPFNIAERPAGNHSPATPRITVSFVVFPEDAESKLRGWNRPPHVDSLPDRFVLLAYSGGAETIHVLGEPVHSPLIVGIDPAAPKEDQLRQDENGDLIVPDDMKWMVDFDLAVEFGMGFRIDLTTEQAAAGFDRLLVIGIRLQSTPDDGKRLVEQLFHHHYFGQAGLAIVPQGTPTNNTEGQGSGHSRIEDSDISFDRLFRPRPNLSSPSDIFAKFDCHWLAEMLGIDASFVNGIANGTGSDQIEARSMNRLLWPATMGYFLQTMMRPVFSDEAIDLTQWYFTHFVSGRGAVPAIRIGSQPYGILPTTAFHQIKWLDDSRLTDEQRDYLPGLHQILLLFDRVWEEMSQEVVALSRPKSDPHQTLLDILGLQPTSAEFHARFAESFDLLFNIMAFFNPAPFYVSASKQIDHSVEYLREKFRYNGTRPAISELFHFGQHFLLAGALVEDLPLSEEEPIHEFGGVENYLQWLYDYGRKNLEMVRLEAEFEDGHPPKALLYLLTRQSIMLGYHDAAYRLYKLLPSTSAAELDEMRREPPFVHIKQHTEISESRWRPLYTTNRLISGPGASSIPIWQYVGELMRGAPEAFAGQTRQMLPLRRQLASFKQLISTPTARLERLLVEHLDCCSYRYDAWLLGLVHLQLALMRYHAAEGPMNLRNPGLFVGAFAWLENVRSENKVLEVKELEPDLVPIFEGDTPIFEDKSNGGYIHAPSLNQAVTAAVLRNGYLGNATPANQQSLAVNLSSNRVRLALSFLEGMRNGQSLGALLGYQLERGLHDSYGLAKCDSFIYDLRRAFPLRAGNLKSTETTDAEKQAVESDGTTKAMEYIEARNVVDGLKLVEHIRQPGTESYPYGLSSLPDAATPVGKAIKSEVDRLLDIHDALADLALAEGVHQATQGNFDRASAALTTMTTGNYPPEPDVVRTPMKGIVLTHRVGLHFDADIESPANAGPRQIAEPALNQWLEERLPPFNQIACTIRWIIPGPTKPIVIDSRPVLISELGIQALDWLALLPPEPAGQLAELDDRVLRQIFRSVDPHPGIEWQIDYERAPDHKIPVAAVAPLTRALRSLTQKARPLKATDAQRQRDAKTEAIQSQSGDRDRVIAVRTALATLQSSMAMKLAALEFMLSDATVHRDEIVNTIDLKLAETAESLERASRFGIVQSGWGGLYRNNRVIHAAIRAALSDRAAQWQARWQEFETAVAAFNALPAGSGDEERRSLLIRAEMSVRATPAEWPANIHDFKTLVDTEGAAFRNRLDALVAASKSSQDQLALLLVEVEALLPLTPFDAEPLDLTRIKDSIVDFAQSLRTTFSSAIKEISNRLTAADGKLDSAKSTTDEDAKSQLLIEAAQSLLGEEFRFIPRFTIPQEQGSEWQNAVAASQDGSLFHYLQHECGVDFPVDEWLYGVARVRPPMKEYEQVLTYCSAFGRLAPELVPAQFPFVKEAPWVALQFPPSYKIGGEHLIYTAAYAAPFDVSKTQCGLLIDEWTEVLPSRDPLPPNAPQDAESPTTHETGLAFHYDRPNNEAPQTMLLVTPASWDGSWKWEEVVNALIETMDLARKRAVEPDMIDSRRLSQFLPATLMANTNRDISIGTLLARNNAKVDP